MSIKHNLQWQLDFIRFCLMLDETRKRSNDDIYVAALTSLTI